MDAQAKTRLIPAEAGGVLLAIGTLTLGIGLLRA
jgi:hypothetical protein